MPAGFSRSEVDAVAALANIQLTDAEAELFATQLSRILDYAEQVQQIDTTGVAPTASVSTAVTERPDVVRPSLTPREAVSNAPDSRLEAGLFRVPRVIG
jgi:aspartyl-tRNA(Asn)/glutamyl-tRNA(Gln) amidotransferase subunit C